MYVCDYCSYWDQGLTNDMTYYAVVTSALSSNEASATPVARSSRGEKITGAIGGAESLSSNEASATPQERRSRR